MWKEFQQALSADAVSNCAKIGREEAHVPFREDDDIKGDGG